MDYQKHKARMAAASRAGSASVCEIGPIKPIADPARRAACAGDLAAFCITYFPATFCLKFSAEHITIIKRFEDIIIRGGLASVALPRGAGKTSLANHAALWAVLCGYRPMVALIAATAAMARDLLKVIATALANNDTLADDWPEVCDPIRALEGIHQRSAGQRYLGRPTAMKWTADKIVFPDIPGSAAAGSCIRVAGLTGAVRGMLHATPDGRTIRPSLVIVDDPQTEQSANSLTQTTMRLNIINGAVLGLAGPGKTISVIMPCTVIRPGDLADQLLDHRQNPRWHGFRSKMVLTWPTPAAEILWADYTQIRETDTNAAGAFYKKNRAAMDAGAVCAWAENYDRATELSAIQHAYNIRQEVGEEAFAAEYQNEPLAGEAAASLAKPEEIQRHIGAHARGRLPDATEIITAMIDVHDKLLFWAVCGWPMAAAGGVVDYGTWPEVPHANFTMRSTKMSLKRTHPGGTVDTAILAGLEAITDQLLGRTFERDDGVTLYIDKLLIDLGYKADLVDTAIKKSDHRARMQPSKGWGIRASSRPMNQWTHHRGDRAGQFWRIPARAGRSLRIVNFDSNFWKSQIHKSLSAPDGSQEALMLPRQDRARNPHRMIADHLTAERPLSVLCPARGQTVDEWHAIPGRDNHLFDCLVGCRVAASVAGLDAARGRGRRREGRRRMSGSADL